MTPLGNCATFTTVARDARGRTLPAAGLLLAAGVLAGACAHVDIDSSRRSGDLDTIEPVLFVVYRNNTPANHPGLIKGALEGQAQRRQIPAKALVISGAELNELETIAHASEGMRGVITISPVGTTTDRNDNMVAVVYDVRAYRIVKKPKPAEHEGRMAVSLMTSDRGELPETAGEQRLVTIWRARVDVDCGRGGAGVGVEALTEDLMRRLVAEHVLAGFGGELGPTPVAEPPI